MSDLTMIESIVDPVCNSDIVVNMKDLEMALTPLQCEQSNAKSFRYQLEEITGSLLEKALRGICIKLYFKSQIPDLPLYV